MDRQTLKELILQSLEHERGGVNVYSAAIDAAMNEDLREEWSKYLKQTRRHVQILESVCKKFEIDAEGASPGRKIVHDLGAALVTAVREARSAGNPAAAQIVECPVLRFPRPAPAPNASTRCNVPSWEIDDLRKVRMRQCVAKKGSKDRIGSG